MPTPTPRSSLLVLLPIVIAACGNDSNPSDDVGPDALAGPPVTVDVLPLCQTYVWEAKVGQIVRQRITNKVAVLDQVGPETAFLVQLCYGGTPSTHPPCPSGMLCTGATAPTLTGDTCNTYYRGGNFVGGKLVLACGGVNQQFDASGAETVHTETGGYASIKLTTY
jgi:hypothetical protein